MSCRKKDNHTDGFRRICVVHLLVPEHAERRIRRRCMSHNWYKHHNIIRKLCESKSEPFPLNLSLALSWFTFLYRIFITLFIASFRFGSFQVICTSCRKRHYMMKQKKQLEVTIAISAHSEENLIKNIYIYTCIYTSLHPRSFTYIYI